jgi:hypothetical protein
MEWFLVIRWLAWRNAGFNKLRQIAEAIADYEPLFDPLVVPLPSSTGFDGSDDALGSLDDAPDEGRPNGDVRVNYPEQRYYSVRDYRELFLSGKLTPTDVAKALLPLIRRDTSPPGEHSTAWFSTKADLVLKAAEASTKRYEESRSLGPLDGVPTAVKV